MNDYYEFNIMDWCRGKSIYDAEFFQKDILIWLGTGLIRTTRNERPGSNKGYKSCEIELCNELAEVDFHEVPERIAKYFNGIESNMDL